MSRFGELPTWSADRGSGLAFKDSGYDEWLEEALEEGEEEELEVDMEEDAEEELLEDEAGFWQHAQSPDFPCLCFPVVPFFKRTVYGPLNSTNKKGCPFFPWPLDI